MSAYNIIDECWIPVRKSDGSSAFINTRDALCRAREFSAIEHASPLVVGSIYRFLCALLYRAVEGPSSPSQARAWFDNGFPLAKIEEYLKVWYDRFWLFDSENAFYQVTKFIPKEWRAWTVLAAEHNADNAKVLFDHIDINSAGMIDPGAATRWLLATQTFSLSCGKSELSHTATAPSATSAIVIPIGRTLHDSLCFCLVPQNSMVLKQDLPVWERHTETIDELKNNPKRLPSGYADRYTWRIRTVNLLKNKSGNIELVGLASGVKVEDTTQQDPMVAYRDVKDRGRLPLTLSSRGIWRDFDSLLPDGTSLAPTVITHALDLAARRTDRFPDSILVLGQINDKAKVECWRYDRFVLPRIASYNPQTRSEVKNILLDAETAFQSLRNSCKLFARHVLSRGGRVPSPADLTSFIKQLPYESVYWNFLELKFHETLDQIKENCEMDLIRVSWLKSIVDALKSSWQTLESTFALSDVWTLRAMVKAEASYHMALGNS